MTKVQNLYKVSLFENVFSKAKQRDIDIPEFVRQLKTNENQRNLILQIRNEPDKKKRNLLKQQLPAITTSVITNGGHSFNDIISHSGLMQVDIDDIPVDNVPTLFNKLKEDHYVKLCFRSPSGKLKCILKIIPDLDMHLYSFLAAEKYFMEKYNVRIDKAAKDATRLMYLSFDPELHYNPESEIFRRMAFINGKPVSKASDGTQEEAIQVIYQIENKEINITGRYNDWINIIFSLIQIFGTDARKYIHQVSRFFPAYTYEETEQKISDCMNSQGEGITKNTFFHYAKQYGIDISSPSFRLEAKGKDKVRSTNSTLTLNKFVLAKRYLGGKYDFRFNTVSLDFEYRLKESKDFRLLNENNLFVELNEKGIGLSLSGLAALLRSDSLVSKYDPFVAYFESLPAWDGKDYIGDLCTFISTKHQACFNNHFQKWLVRLVACALLDNYYNKQAFILVGPKHDTGKSTFCRFLCPPAIKNYIGENISTDKDSRIMLAKNILINLDELSTMGKSDINSLKALFSKDKINERLPYDRKNSIISRRCSFIGSTNQREFLFDETGSVRWLCFEVQKIDWDYSKKIDINKVYSQAYSLFRNGEFNYNLTREEIQENETRNKAFFQTSTESELINQFFEADQEKNDLNFQTASGIIIKLDELTKKTFRLNPVQIGKALKFLGFEKVKNSKYDAYGYFIRERKHVT